MAIKFRAKDPEPVAAVKKAPAQDKSLENPAADSSTAAKRGAKAKKSAEPAPEKDSELF